MVSWMFCDAVRLCCHDVTSVYCFWCSGSVIRLVMSQLLLLEKLVLMADKGELFVLKMAECFS